MSTGYEFGSFGRNSEIMRIPEKAKDFLNSEVSGFLLATYQVIENQLFELILIG
jgi:hypothetical protein